MTPSDETPVQTAGDQWGTGDQGRVGDPARRQGAGVDGDRLDPRALAAVGATVVFWTSAFPGIKAALEAYTPVRLAPPPRPRPTRAPDAGSFRGGASREAGPPCDGAHRRRSHPPPTRAAVR